MEKNQTIDSFIVVKKIRYSFKMKNVVYRNYQMLLLLYTKQISFKNIIMNELKLENECLS